MADLGEELLILGGGGRLGTALQLARYWPAAVCGLMIPGVLTGQLFAVLVLLAGLAGVALTFTAEKKMRAHP